MRTYLSLLVVSLVSLASGCSTAGTSIPLGSGTYSATDPARIEMLIEPPTRTHKAIALVEGTAATDDYYSEARTQAAAIEAMKKEAARLGAHAIVLTAKGSRPYGQMVLGSTTAAGTGFATTTAMGLGFEKITLSGTAIRYGAE